ncbi:MAG: CBS domain-containing protein [Streptosporangiales bacterium]|nr:CBS domain-containing protein [Streptosporangiales bacterium]
MAQKVRDVMTSPPVTVSADTTLREVAQTMRDTDIGTVVVTRNGDVLGVVTDRDMVVRAFAEDGAAGSQRVEDICSSELVTVTPDTDADDAVQLMRRHAVRRLPVVDGNRPVGVVSIGDLAVDRDRKSALADISAAPPNT